MISKIAIQAGLGVTAVGGMAGAVTYALWDDGTEYLLAISESVSNTASDPMQHGAEKNYYCQWETTTSSSVGTTDNNKPKDNNCEIKQINFDAKKFILLSDITLDTSKTITDIKDNLKAENNWFLLKIKGYVDDLSKKIEIKSKKPNETKKYATLKPVVKIKGSAFTGQTNFVLTQLLQDPQHQPAANSTYKCKLEKEGDENLQDCDVYKFVTELTEESQTKKINNLDLTDSNKTTKITSPSTDDFKNQKFYLIDLKTKKLDLFKNSDTKIVYVSVTASTENKKVGDFKIKSYLINKDSNTTTTWTSGVNTIVLYY